MLAVRLRLRLRLPGASGSRPSWRREKVPSEWTDNCNRRRRDRGRGCCDLVDAGEDESSAWEVAARPLPRSEASVETSDGVFKGGAVGPAGSTPEGLASGFTPETLSSLNVANEKADAVGDGNADPGVLSVTSYNQLVRLTCPGLLPRRSVLVPEHRLPALSRDDAWLGARSSSSRGGE